MAKPNTASDGKGEKFTSQSRAKKCGFGDEGLNDEDKDEALSWHSSPVFYSASIFILLHTFDGSSN